MHKAIALFYRKVVLSVIFGNSKVYDVVKWLIIVGLPSISVFIATLGQIYGFNSDVIVLTINAVAVLLGSLLGVSGIRYQKTLEEPKQVG